MTRPTSDRVRQALFNVLAHGINGFDLEGARVFDLFAGSGALGIEALSRGAETATFVETGGDARAAIRANIDAFGLGGITRILKRDACDLGPCQPSDPFTLCFLDPPYGRGLGERALSAALAGAWLTDDAVVVLEEERGAEIAWPRDIAVIDVRTYGDTTLHIARVSAAA